MKGQICEPIDSKRAVENGLPELIAAVERGEIGVSHVTAVPARTLGAARNSYGLALKSSSGYMLPVAA
jgi:hypothetical protein